MTLDDALLREMRAAFEEGLRRGVEKGGAMLAQCERGDDGALCVQLLRVEQEGFETEVPWKTGSVPGVVRGVACGGAGRQHVPGGPFSVHVPHAPHPAGGTYRLCRCSPHATHPSSDFVSEG